jgi:hypothetical protein
MKKFKTVLSILSLSIFVFLAFGSVDDDSSSSSSSSSETSLPSGGPDVCDCLQNAMNAGTYEYDEYLQASCEEYSSRLTEAQKSQRISEASDRGCI